VIWAFTLALPTFFALNVFPNESVCCELSVVYALVAAVPSSPSNALLGFVKASGSLVVSPLASSVKPKWYKSFVASYVAVDAPVSIVLFVPFESTNSSTPI
jgi:hypothetical protein